jgi:hypothetical protein
LKAGTIESVIPSDKATKQKIAVPKLAPLKATGDANLNFVITVTEEKPTAKNNNAKAQTTK